MTAVGRRPSVGRMSDDVSFQGREVPIACSLGADDRRVRAAAWRDVVDLATGRSSIPGGVRIELAATAPLDELVRLVAAEYDCCRFFSFAVTIDGRGAGLEVTAPADAQDVLVSLFGG